MAVTDGPDATVAWLGTDDVGRAQFPDARVIDLDGGFVAPAFVDSHVHLTATGLASVGLDLRAATSLTHLLGLVADYAREHPDGPIWAHGWDESGWPERVPPTTSDLDGVLGRRPAYLARVDVHSAAATSALRELVPELPGSVGYAERLPLTSQAHHRVRAVARELLTAGQLHAARIAALDLAARSGIVAVHECAGPDIGGLDDWHELRATRHGVEVVGYWGEAVSTAGRGTDLIELTGARGLAGDLFVDGALGSRTAWLHAPYADDPTAAATPTSTPTPSRRTCSACTQAGVTAGFHVIGDAAVVRRRRRAAPRRRPTRRRGRRALRAPDRASGDGDRRAGGPARRWGVIASVQPNFDALWGGEAGMYARGSAPTEPAAQSARAVSIPRRATRLRFRYAVTSINPWETVRAAIRHQTPGSALSARAAFSAATRGAWRAGGVRDGITGTLVPGAPASYAVWEAGGSTGGRRARRRRAALVDRSTSRVPALPRLGVDDPLPRAGRRCIGASYFMADAPPTEQSERSKSLLSPG